MIVASDPYMNSAWIKSDQTTPRSPPCNRNTRIKERMPDQVIMMSNTDQKCVESAQPAEYCDQQVEWYRNHCEQ